MLEASAAFIAGVLLTWPAIVGLLLLGLLFEHNGARTSAVFTAILVAIISYFFFDIPLMTIALYGVGYIIVGVIWSVYRYKRYADKVVKENIGKESHIRDYAIRSLHPTSMMGTITAWMVIWPLSMVENVTGDLVSGLQMFVTKMFRGVYHRIFSNAVDALSK